MDFSKLNRNADKVKTKLKEVESDGSLITLEPCKIYIPEFYSNTELCTATNDISFLAVFAIVYDNSYYGVSSACALFNTVPSQRNTVTIENEKYFEFSYEAGDKIMTSCELIRSKTIVYRIYNEIISKGKVPKYLEYDDLAQIFSTARLHANVNLGADSALLELLAMVMARVKGDLNKFFRHLTKFGNDVKPAIIGLNSVSYQAVNTTAKYLGNYHNEAVTSALVHKSENVESIEKALRN